MTLLGRDIQELDAVSNELSAIAGKSTHEIKPGSPLCRYFCVWQLAYSEGVITANRSGLPDLVVNRTERELNMREKMMSYQPQTEAATSRF